MPISKKDTLYLLVKSLTKTEKKYFRDFQNKSPDSKLYLMLFNKIDKQSKHKKQEIKKLFDNKAKQLPVIKTYLTKLILKILNFYHYDSSTTNKIQNYFLEINHLIERELFDLAQSKIKAAIKQAEQADLHIELLKALDLEKKLLIKQYGATSEAIKKDINHIIEKQAHILRQLENLYELEKMQANFFDYFQQGSGLNPTIYTTIDKNPLIINENKALSLAAKTIQADIQYRTHIFKDKNYQKAQSAVQNIIRQMEMSPGTIQDKPDQYLNLLNHKLQLLIFTKSVPELENLLIKIRKAPKKYGFDIRKPHLRRYVMEAFALELEVYKNTSETKKAEHIIEIIDKTLKDLHSPLLRQWRTVMNYEIAKYYFETNHIEAAKKRLLQIKNAEYSLREIEVLIRSIFMRAQIAIIQKNNLELRKTLEDLKEFFKTQKKPTRLEKHLQKLIQDWTLYSPYPKKHKKLTDQIQKTQKAAEAIPQPELEDLIEWISTLSPSEE